jgi:phospholipid/cholesterol/gamma-HCH transport system substrate-binding protein
MESQVKYTFVGLGIIILFSAMLYTLLWLSQDETAGGRKSYTIYFAEQSLDGLQLESAVTLKGIAVGRVKKIQLSDHNIELVRVLIDVSASTPIKINTHAIIKRNILTGLATIDLAGGTNESPALENIVVGENYPIIPEGQSEFSQFAASIPELVEDVNQVVTRVNNFLSEDNQLSFGKTLKNVETITDSMANSNEKFKDIVADLSDLAKNLREMSTTLTSVSKKAESSISTITNDFSKTLQTVTETAEAIRVDSDELSKSVTTASRLFTQNTDQIADSMSQAAKSLSRTAEGFEDPKSIITGPGKNTLGPGELIGR